MTSQYVFLLMAVCSFGMLGVLHKVADYRGCRPEAANLFLFLGATVLMCIYAALKGDLAEISGLSSLAWLVAAGCGLLTSLAILNFQRGIRFGKISTSWLVINLSTVLPMILSILIYKEVVSIRRGAGLVLAALAIALLWQERRLDEARERTTGK
ncbi:MAG: EamA family transporter [Bryobacteraceae bacterium]|nr:DMT family transporter [Bryobacterales bacterium]MEB2360803.1 EamA family transporter [Bryobacterales bacterium]NUN03428.1 EamA family transporter [Bryobacteraceae bacterium]